MENDINIYRNQTITKNNALQSFREAERVCAHLMSEQQRNQLKPLVKLCFSIFKEFKTVTLEMLIFQANLCLVFPFCTTLTPSNESLAAAKLALTWMKIIISKENNNE